MAERIVTCRMTDRWGTAAPAKPSTPTARP